VALGWDIRCTRCSWRDNTRPRNAAASGMEAATAGETEGLDPKDDSPAPQGDAHTEGDR
jgi:hypothetical protein